MAMAKRKPIAYEVMQMIEDCAFALRHLQQGKFVRGDAEHMEKMAARYLFVEDGHDTRIPEQIHRFSEYIDNSSKPDAELVLTTIIIGLANIETQQK